ncbi:MAG: hypothetical protein MUC83_17085, partial [Pirellula sp.]|nr:hypothetical protein [Pirellula sp.]
MAREPRLPQVYFLRTDTSSMASNNLQNRNYPITKDCNPNMPPCFEGMRNNCSLVVVGLLFVLGCHSRKANVWNPEGTAAPIAKIATSKPKVSTPNVSTPRGPTEKTDSPAEHVESLHVVEVAANSALADSTSVTAASFVQDSGIDPVASYTLSDLETLALGNNPAISSADALTRKAAGLQYQVGLRP